MLRALGFGSDVHLYVASGEVYGGEETLAPLKQLFPNFYTKETIASKEELAPFTSFSSRMAALDFIVCDESDVFVTNNNGNMARILAGRRYLYFFIKFLEIFTRSDTYLNFVLKIFLTLMSVFMQKSLTIKDRSVKTLTLKPANRSFIFRHPKCSSKNISISSSFKYIFLFVLSANSLSNPCLIICFYTV